MPIKARPKTLAALSESDKKVLKALYLYRCLDEALMQRFFYAAEDDGNNDFTRKRIHWFIREELIHIDEYSDGKCAFYLTNRGLQTARELLIRPTFVIDQKTGRRKYDVTSAAIRTAPRLLEHQMLLNAFSLDIVQRCSLNPECYKDSKFADNFTYAQPDGVFELPDCDIFLEMDLAHENLTKLKGKWSHYRNYCSAREYYLRRNKKIVILFATENIRSGFGFRRSKVIQSIMDSIPDLLGDRFNIYVGPSSELAAIAEELIAGRQSAFHDVGAAFQSRLGFQFKHPGIVSRLCRGERYLYMRQVDGSGETLIQDGCPQEFFLENYLSRPIASLKRAITHGHTQSLLRGKFPAAPLLLLVTDEQSIYKDLRAADGLGLENVFFITERRLKERIFPNALFQFDQAGNRYHFADYSYSKTVHEKKG